MPPRKLFPTTSWTLVLQAAGDRKSALEQFCTTYWPPVFAFIRARVRDPEEAKDLTQAFFARLLEKHDLAAVKPGRGGFRSYLFATLSHFLSNERDWARAQKRGGGRPLLSLDAEEGEWRRIPEPAERLTPEEIFERHWALLVLDRALAKLRRQHEASGQAAHFEALKEFLTGPADSSYRDAATTLGVTEAAAKMAIHRLRRRFSATVREEVALTLADPTELEGELHYLLSVLTRSV